MKQDEILENQIGSLGDDSMVDYSEKEDVVDYTEKEDVVEDSNIRSLGRAKYVNSDRDKPTTDTPIKSGKMLLDREEMGERSQFYPMDWEFWIRPASVQDIKSWSSIDDENLKQINDALNEILKSCLTIKCSKGAVTWSRINSWDRLWFLMKIREYTFVEGENSIEFDAECIYCDNNIHYKLTSDALVFDAPDMETVGRHWNAESMLWSINPKEYDVPGSPIVTLYNPSIEKDAVILNYLQSKVNADKNIDTAFTQFLPWLLPRVSRDQRVIDKLIAEAEGIYKSWSIGMYNFMVEVLKNVSIKPSEQLNAICNKCGEEVVSQIRFPDDRGLKSLFAVQGKHKKFGSK